MNNGPVPTGSFEIQQEPTSSRSWMNVALIGVLVLLVVGLGTVGFLLARKRGYFPWAGKPRSTESSPASQGITVPPGTKPIDSYTPERPWQEGDPTPSSDDTEGGGPEADEQAPF